MPGCSATSALSSRRIRRPVALPPACATRRRECPPSSPSARWPWRSASNVTPSRSRSRKRAGASSTRMRAAEARTIPRPAAIVSSQVQLRRVVGGERGREPALGPVRRGLGQRAGGDQGDVGALARGGQRGVEPGRAGAHDDEVGPVHGEEPVRYPRAPDRLAAPPALARPRGAAAPGAAGADHRAGGGDGAPRLVRVRRRAGAGGDAGAAARRAPGRAHRLHRGAVRLRGRADRLRHGRDAGDLRGGGAVGGGRCRAGGCAARAARRRRGSPPCGRPGTTRSRRGRWGSASSATWRWPRGTLAPRMAWSGCWCWTGTCTTATGPTRSSRPTRACCSSRSTSGRCIRGRGRRPIWGRATARATPSTCRCRAGRATRPTARWSTTSCCR